MPFCTSGDEFILLRPYFDMYDIQIWANMMFESAL